MSGAPPVLPGFLGALAPVLNQWGYLAIGGLVMLEDFGVPVPGETVLIAGAVYAGAGQLNIAAVIVIAIAAAIIGDSIGFGIGRFGGRRLVLRYGKYVFLNEHRLATAESFFVRHGGKIVTVARFIEGLRQANGIIAGITGMRWVKFAAFNALGAVLWVGLWSGLGYAAGTRLPQIWSTIERYQPIAYGVIGALVLGLIGWHLARRRRKRQAMRTEPTLSRSAPSRSAPSLPAPSLPAPESEPEP